jgi:hypothetical protein
MGSMALEFDTRYAIGVLVFMVVLFFCKSLLECVDKCMNVLAACAHVNCAQYLDCLALNHGQKESFRNIQVVFLLLLSACKPLVILLGSACGELALGHKPRWTVGFVHVFFNQSSFTHTQGHAGDWPVNHSDLVRERTFSSPSRATEVDGLFLVMPFALISACSTWTWITLKNDGFFDSDPVWDADLFNNRAMQLFEILYGFETFTLLFGLLSIAGDPVMLEYVLMIALSLTLLLLYLFAFSRGPRSEVVVESAFGVVILVMIAVIVSFFLVEYTGQCVISRSAACSTVALVIAISLLHAGSKEEALAGRIILYRTLFSCFATIYFAVLAAIDSNSACT